MERVTPTPEPVGWAEFTSAIVAILFALLAAGGLGRELVAARASATTAPSLVTRAVASDVCSAAPAEPLAMRLGLTRNYPPPINITMEPVPYALQPGISGEEAYRRSGQRLSGCETEDLLGFYTSADPRYDHVLAWVLVTTLACPSEVATPSGADASRRLCYSISPIDATTGAAMGTRIFPVPQ